MRIFADLAEHPRAKAAGTNTKLSLERTEFFKEAWVRCENFLRAAQTAYINRLPEAERPSVDDTPTDPGLLAPAFRERLRAAMRIPAMEALFPKPWTAAARRVLPSPSPQFTATAMWGPILAWCALELLAESINIEQPERVALDIFDRLRLREPFAQSFTALGFEGEEAWRAAARIKVVLLIGAGVGKAEEMPSRPEPTIEPESVTGIESKSRAEIEGQGINSDTAPVSGHDFSRAESQPDLVRALAPGGSPSPESKLLTEPESLTDEKIALAPALWHDADVRWLTGIHEAEGHLYLVREQYEELLWWLLMPSLLRLASGPTPNRIAIEELSNTVEEALGTAESANYRIDELLGSEIATATEEPVELKPEDDSKTIEEGIVESIESVPGQRE